MKQRMKILNQKILSSGNTRKIILGVLYFSFFIVGIFVWCNFPEGRLNQNSKFWLTVVLMFLIATVKQTFISVVTIPGKGAQNIATGLLVFPVNRKEILWSHFKSVLATQTIVTILLAILLLLTQNGLILLDLIWVGLLFAVPILIVGIDDRMLIKRE